MKISYSIEPRFTKTDIHFFTDILNRLDKSNTLVFPIKDIAPRIKKDKKIDYLEKFIRKNIRYQIDETLGIIMPFSHVTIHDENIEIHPSKFFIETIKEKNQLKVLDLKTSLKFKETFTKLFYYQFVISTMDSKNIIISLKDLRVQLNLKEYERFYDFERNILKKLVYDIESNSNYSIKYKKIKKGEAINTKVESLEFEINSKLSKKKQSQTNKLIGIISEDIEDYYSIYQFIYKSLDKLSFIEVKYILNKCKNLNIKNPSQFEKVIKNTITKKITINNYPLLLEINKLYKSPIALEHDIFTQLKNLKKENFLEKELLSTKFLKKLYFTKNGEKISFETDKILIVLRYFKEKESIIKVFEKI